MPILPIARPFSVFRREDPHTLVGMTTAAKQTNWVPSAITLGVESLGILVQLLLLVIGFIYLDSDEDAITENVLLSTWCLIATLHLAFAVVWLNIDVRVRDHDDELFKRFSAAPVLRWISTAVTFSSSLVGLAAATTLMLGPNEPNHEPIFDLVAVWAMLSSWAMFHWGYARIYHSKYNQRPEERMLRFPGTEHPRLIDFVYFAFTNGTSFAPSDVSVASSRMRWTVVWHTTFSFFFNALIIVLSMNTLSGGLAFL